MKATTKKSRKPTKRARRVKKPVRKVVWTGPKGKLTWVCTVCFEDTALPAEDQFGFPRGRDIRKEHDKTFCGRKDGRYCGTCGEDHSIARIRV